MKMIQKNPKVYRFLMKHGKLNVEMGDEMRPQLKVTLTMDLQNQEQADYLTSLANDMNKGSIDDLVILKFFKKR